MTDPYKDGLQILEDISRCWGKEGKRWRSVAAKWQRVIDMSQKIQVESEKKLKGDK